MLLKKGRIVFITISVLIVCLLVGKLFFFSKKPFSICGYSFLIVASASMEPEYRVNSLVIIKHESFDNLKVGDVVMFKSTALNGGLAFHRITELTSEFFYTKGDNNTKGDNQQVTRQEYIGKGVANLRYVGVYISSIRKPIGFIVFLLLPFITIILIWDTIKNMLQKRRKP